MLRRQEYVLRLAEQSDVRCTTVRGVCGKERQRRLQLGEAEQR